MRRPFPIAMSVLRWPHRVIIPMATRAMTRTGVRECPTVDFTVLGQSFVGLNGGPNFKPNEAVSLMVVTENQEETDRYWNAIVGNGGQESACGWCKDRWGFSWQITPRILLEANNSPDKAAAKRAFEAMMTMKKIDVAKIEAALKGETVHA